MTDTSAIRENLRRLRAMRAVAKGSTAELERGIRAAERELERRATILDDFDRANVARYDPAFEVGR